MIRIGFNTEAKQLEINKYLDANPDIKKIIVLYHKNFKEQFEANKPIEYIEYADIIMYKFFYRLLEEIDNTHLIIVNECMQTQNRRELTYNCAHHYLNQTEHKIVFENFPFIESQEDFMILLDFQNKNKYKGKSFDWNFILNKDIEITRHNLKFESLEIPLTAEQKDEYLKKKEELLNDLKSKDPNILPRELHLWLGQFKKHYIKADKKYLARNSRFKADNIETYRGVKNANLIVIDFPCRRLDFIRYLKDTKTNKVAFLNTCTGADEWYFGDYTKWNERLEEFYAKTSVCE